MAFFTACQSPEDEVTAKKNEEEKEAKQFNPDWTEISHGNVNPDYNVVLPQEVVNKIEITLTQQQWKEIRTNMTILYGIDFGGGNKPGQFTEGEPDYKDVLFKFNGKQWKNVGFRLKGNSSLRSIWGQGNYKLPFRLNFDRFEEIIPEIKNQHFYGFEELTFSPGFKDPSLIREKMAADVFRMGGIPAPITAFYRVYIDFGIGMKYCGIYTCVEVPEDNMIKAQFKEEKGNIYKPTSKLTLFRVNEFEKKNNDSIPNYTDVQTFISVLNNNNMRMANAVEWRKNLENTFNVSHFLKWLAINNTIVNWDTYGIMAHNYYLYNHTVNKLTWIPWDNNEAFLGSPGITGANDGTTPPQGPKSGLSLTMNEVKNDWPLIRYLADDTTCFKSYRGYIREFKNTVFTETTMTTMVNNYFSLITPYVIGAEGEQPGYSHISGPAAFTSAINEFKNHIKNRIALATSFTK